MFIYRNKHVFFIVQSSLRIEKKNPHVGENTANGFFLGNCKPFQRASEKPCMLMLLQTSAAVRTTTAKNDASRLRSVAAAASCTMRIPREGRVTSGGENGSREGAKCETHSPSVFGRSKIKMAKCSRTDLTYCTRVNLRFCRFGDYKEGCHLHGDAKFPGRTR